MKGAGSTSPLPGTRAPWAPKRCTHAATTAAAAVAALAAASPAARPRKLLPPRWQLSTAVMKQRGGSPQPAGESVAAARVRRSLGPEAIATHAGALLTGATTMLAFHASSFQMACEYGQMRSWRLFFGPSLVLGPQWCSQFASDGDRWSRTAPLLRFDQSAVPLVGSLLCPPFCSSPRRGLQRNWVSEPDHGRPPKRQRAESPPIPPRSLSDPGALTPLRRSNSASAIAPVRGGGGSGGSEAQQPQPSGGGSNAKSGSGSAPTISGTAAADEGFPGHNSVVDVHPASKLVGAVAGVPHVMCDCLHDSASTASCHHADTACICLQLRQAKNATDGGTENSSYWAGKVRSWHDRCLC